MIRYLCAATLLAAAFAAVPATATDLSQQDPIVVNVDLGSKGGDVVFTPNDLGFEAGKLYKLVLHNPSTSKHYFSAPKFAAAVWTRKIEAGKAEVKGAVREIELKPGGEAEWFFVPVGAGTFPLQCTIPGHAEAGMVGTVKVQ